MNSDSYWNTQLLDSPDNFLQKMIFKYSNAYTKKLKLKYRFLS